MLKNDEIQNENEVASRKRDINDILGANDYDRMQALDSCFTKSELGTPTKEDRALMEDATIMLQEEIKDSSDLEYTDDDYEEVTKELYEDLLDEDAGTNLRGRAVIDFAIGLLKKAFESLEEPLEEEKDDEEAAAEEGTGE
jgi:tetratricopeptide (TPR) repeat protein